jgi:hypothetical protein
MSDFLEVVMIISFGASWPLNVIKSYKARTTKGKSLGFLCLIFSGYIAGILSKLLNESYMASFSSKWYLLFFYVLNLIMVGTDLCIYFRNRKLDKKKETEAKTTVIESDFLN